MYVFSSTRPEDKETALPMIERHTVGRFASLARLPVLLATTAGIIAKIAIKALIIAPAESLVNLGLYIYAKATNQFPKYTSLLGADKKGFSADFGNLGLTLKRIIKFAKRVIVAPSQKAYAESMDFPKLVKQSGLMVFTSLDVTAEDRKQKKDLKREQKWQKELPKPPPKVGWGQY